MRLQLTKMLWFRWVGVALCLFVPAGVQAAEDTEEQKKTISGDASARVDVYRDPNLLVIAPAIHMSLEPVERLDLDVNYGVQFVSGATPALVADTADVVSSATPFVEQRHSADLSATGEVRDKLLLGGSYFLSVERDFMAHGLGVSLSGDAFKSMATLAAAYNVSVQRAWTATDEAISEMAVEQNVDLSWVQILSKSTRLTALGSVQLSLCGDVLGCHANPYRYVAMLADDDVLFALREHHPENRVRSSAALRLSQSLHRNVALHMGYRFYGDSWKVTGHTGDLALAVAFFDQRLILRGEGRGSWQGAASFYRDEYVVDPATPSRHSYYTADRELSGLWDISAGLRLSFASYGVGPFRVLDARLRLAHTWFRYPNYSEMPKRNAWLFGGGVQGEF